MARTFAIARDSDLDRIALLWCSGRSGRASKGGRLFSVINGNWDGSIDANGVVYVRDKGSSVPGNRIVWEGEVPAEFSRNYNDAIKWIKTQLGCDGALS